MSIDKIGKIWYNSNTVKATSRKVERESIMVANKRLENIYAEAVNFVEGMNMSAKELFEIMSEAKEYTVTEICIIIDKLYTDGFINK